MKTTKKTTSDGRTYLVMHCRDGGRRRFSFDGKVWVASLRQLLSAK